MPYLLKPTVTETFLDRVKLTPNAIGYQVREAPGKWRTFTFRQFYDQCEKVAHGLLALGAQAKDCTVIISRSRMEWSVADLAIIGIGGFTVPIYPSLTPPEVEQLIHHCEAKLVFVEDKAQLKKLIASNTSSLALKKIIVFDPTDVTTDGQIMTFAQLIELGALTKGNSTVDFAELLLKPKPEDVFTIAYTSGTTGQPKGAMITHANLFSAVGDGLKIVKNYTQPESETLLTFLPFSHIIGRGESLATFTYGWCESYILKIEDILPALLEVKPTILFGVPRIFEKSYGRFTEVLKSKPLLNKVFRLAYRLARTYYDKKFKQITPSLSDRASRWLMQNTVFRMFTHFFGGRLRYAACGGAPLSEAVAEFFQTMGIPICEGYGLTETCAPVSLNTPECFRYGSVGKPLADVNLRFGEDGEIIIQSKKVFAGYYKMPAETALVLKEGWFHTGDLGHLDKDGFLYITGRKKDLIITSGGKNIAPQKIESLAANSSLFEQFVVLGDRKPYLVALITLNRELVKTMVQESFISDENYAQMITHPLVLEKVNQEIKNINSQLASFETIKKFSILQTNLSIETGHLTPTLKIKRHRVAEDFANEVEKLYLA